METTNLQNNYMDENTSIQTPHLKRRQVKRSVNSVNLRIKEPTHEEKVEKFFSHGADTRAVQENGFLSFGYWTKSGQNYLQAAESLLELLLSHETSLNRGTILDVACGYGTETFKIYDKLKPSKIIAIDITNAHIEHAKTTAMERNLADKISFEKQDACILPYPSKSFAYVFGVEGPSQFNTRELFLKRAYNVLETNGVLLLADVIIHKKVALKGWINRMIGRLLSKQWYIPESNWMNFESYRKMLVNTGYEVDFIRGIGANVYNGFASFNTKWSSIKNAVRVRGLGIGLGLTLISWLLGVAFKRGMLDYAFIRAVKN
ncbi:MAG: methyltransferase domain-containing protein [Bacteroidales bacterium]|nr:methyltransferase domain-containing protein [Bacteroidales bacterium]